MYAGRDEDAAGHEFAGYDPNRTCVICGEPAAVLTRLSDGRTVHSAVCMRLSCDEAMRRQHSGLIH